MRRTTLILSTLILLLISSPNAVWGQEGPERGVRGVARVYQESCAVCHGEQMQGSPQGTALVGVDLHHGVSMDHLVASIGEGYPDRGMPEWGTVLDAEQIKSLAMWILENREGLRYEGFNLNSQLTLPTAPIHSLKHAFSVELVADDLDPLPYSIALMPDGAILLTEKTAGLRIISPDGQKSEFIEGTPTVFDGGRQSGSGLFYGQGWLLDVSLHPDYAENGWIYLHHTDRCEDCSALSREAKRAVSMNRLVRGRIADGQWTDEEVIWQADVEKYSLSSDLAAGGRTAFDPDGFVYVSVGMHGRDTVQNLAHPDGKVHRVHLDGRVPSDNPFAEHPTAMKSIWSYGHRSPQGLEFNTESGELWGTEHGPRGGDEVNRLLPGRNYGWPLYSLGQNYNGTEVAHGRAQSEVELNEIEQPVIDWTPSPAISSFVFYEGDAFPEWQGDMLVGTLKASDLVRVRIVDDQVVEQETLIEDLARVRDVEVAGDGSVLLLLEHAQGSKIVRLRPLKETVSR